jgi:ribonuclease G
MSKELVISATPHETRVAIVEDGQLCEIYIEREKEFALVGSLYKGRVTRVLPGMQSAFVDIGLDSDAFLYVSDFLENLEDYDHVPHPVEAKVERMEQQGGEVFASPANGGAEREPISPETVTPPSPESIPAASPVAETTAVPPAAQVRQPYEPRQDRGHGDFRNRGRRGGRNRRWGRRGQDRHQGRELPPSKYASSDSRVGESQPYETPSANYEPVILPGESLAKYKDRIPLPSAAPVTEEASGTPPPRVESEAAASKPAEEHRGTSLPESVYAAPTAPLSAEEKPVAEQNATAQTADSQAGESTAVPSAEDYRRVTETETMPSEAGTGKEMEAGRHNGADLSEEEVTALAEQLAEAKHEEAQAETDSRMEAEEAGAEAFVEAAELDQSSADESSEEESEEGAETESGEQMQEESLSAETFEEQQENPEVPEPAQAFEPQQTSARISDRPRARFQKPMRRGGRHRGGRRGGRPQQDFRHRPHPSQRPSYGKPQLISEMLKAGQEIIVQIAKEPLGKKGARITSHVALPGRYLVYMPTVDHIGVSRRIGSAEERSRLRRVVGEAKGSFPGGFIVRTAAAAASDDEIRSDAEFLGRTWDTIRSNAEQRRAPSLLHRDLNLVERILRDYLSSDYVAIWIDNEEEYSKVVEFVSHFQPKMVGRVKLYTKESPIFEEFGIQQELDKALRPKVWLKSGGYIVINHTEALVAIDVNTGKYVGRGSTRLEDTIVKTNLEAVKEIVRQIRLRDLGGIIVVDFIDMEERRNREKVMSALEQALNQDRAPSKALPFNEFGLVAITRKRTKQALERVLCQPCPYCTGSGMVKSIPTICYEIQAEARKMAADLDAQSITLRVNPEIAKALKTRESSLIEELEQATRKSAIIQSDPTLHWEQYDIY